MESEVGMEVATKIIDTELMETLYGIPVVQAVAKSGSRYLKIGWKREWPKDCKFKSEFDSIMLFFNDENGSLTLTFQVATSFQPYEKKSDLTKILYGNWEKEGKAKRAEKQYMRFHKGFWAIKYKLTKTGKFQVIKMNYSKRKKYPTICSITDKYMDITKEKINWLVGNWKLKNATNAAMRKFLMQTIEQQVAKLKERANGTQKPAIAVA